MKNGQTIEKDFIKVREAYVLTGIEYQTIRKLVDTGKVKGYKTPSGQRMVNKASLQEMCLAGIPSNVRKTKEPTIKNNYIYARVSSKKQMDDLHRQIEFIKSNKPEYASYTIISDIGSGINFRRKGIETILDECLRKQVGNIIIAHKDRLCRFGYELLEQLVKKSGGKIIVTESSENKSTEQELAEDILSIVHIFSCRQMGKRKYKTCKSKDIESENLSDDQTETDT